MLDSLVPRLRAGVRLTPRDDGTSVLVEASRGLYVEIAADQANLLSLVDGRRSTSEIAADHYAAHRFVPFQALGDMLATLRARDLLENPAGELDQAGVPRAPPAAKSRQLASVLLARFNSAAVGPVAIGLAAILLIVGVVSLGAAVLVQGPGWTADAHIDPLRPGGSPLRGLGFLLLGAFEALVARSVAKGGLSALLGAPPGALELRLHYFLPALELDNGPVKLLGRGRRIACYAAGLVAPWLVALAWLGLPSRPEVAASVALGAAVVGFIDACPFAPTSMGSLLATLAGRVDLRDHARSYLSRKLLSRLSSKEFFDGEKVILVTSTLSALWSMAGVDVLARNGAHELVFLYASTVAEADASSGEIAAAYLLMALLSVGSLAALFLMGQTLLSALGSVVPTSMRRKVTAATRTQTLSDQGAGGGKALSLVPLFAALPPAALEDLAREVSRVSYAPGAVIVRQGDHGDRFYAIVEGTVDIIQEHDSGLERVVAELSAGDCFGETALLAPVPRGATVKAHGNVTALALSFDGFKRLVDSMKTVDLTRLIRAAATLNRNPLFSALAPERISSLLPRLVPKSVAAGVEVVRRGDAGDFFYLVDDGELEVLDEEGQQRVATLGKGDHFGEVALLRDVPRMATVRATRETSLWSLSKADFFSVLGRDLSLSRNLEEEARVRVRGGR